MFLELLGIFKDAIIAYEFKEAYFHLLPVEVDILFINKVHFQHLRLVLVEGLAAGSVKG